MSKIKCPKCGNEFEIDQAQKKASEAILEYLKTDFVRAMSKYN